MSESAVLSLSESVATEIDSLLSYNPSRDTQGTRSLRTSTYVLQALRATEGLSVDELGAKVGDEQATVSLIAHYLTVIESNARKFGTAIDFDEDDAFQEGVEALINAARKAAEEGRTLTGYAPLEILEKVSDARTRMAYGVAIPPRSRKRYRALMAQANQDPEVAATLAEDATDITPETFWDVHFWIKGDGSKAKQIDEPFGRDGLTVAETYAMPAETDEVARTAEDQMVEAGLTTRESDVVRANKGLYTDAKTQAEIAESLGVSQQAVAKSLKSGLAKLRTRLPEPAPVKPRHRRTAPATGPVYGEDLRNSDGKTYPVTVRKITEG